jgi:hypothetical protein
MSKHFILFEGLFREISDKFSNQIKYDTFGNIVCGENYICSYNARKKLAVKTQFIELSFDINNNGRIINNGPDCECMLYFLLHASDEAELGNSSQSHFQIRKNKKDSFWINSGARNDFYSKTQVVFFMHEQRCTAYSFFLKILSSCTTMPDLFEEIQELFVFHNMRDRLDKRKAFLTGLGYGDKTANDEKYLMNHNDIKKYYV